MKPNLDFSFMSLSILLLLICSCGKNASEGGANGSSSFALSSSGACSNSIVAGNWRSISNGKLLKLTGDCRYILDSCKSTGTYPPNILSNAGTLLITIESKGSDAPSGCLPVGSYNCSYDVDKSVTPNQLGVLCASVYGVWNKE